MAETRKYRPANSAVGDAIRAALGESVRPVAPGSRPEPEPETEHTEQTGPDAPAVTVRTFTFGTATKPPTLGQ